ncbi:lysylphosphatidylglycerol synthetase family protein [Erysipelothrix sp. HDW6A]|uniref:phosphatidylglycerol lysyltransferase domain-containing protein n=1 Tax=Erysipelothrix sp. HDW6A TaxID=2714928 RepID=UPI00140AA38F|nr:phosphatidylglycerol lysyltransferase domain-containing protein [Erysipelothrix sp. HDW6A]QIK56516.1 lysylphosphatidylglycerol synthetase family protein [Erysipelothrix sp. HDW6A]
MNKIKKLIKPLFFITILAITVNKLIGELSTIDFQKVYSTMQNQSFISIIVLVLVGLVGVSILSLYDLVLVKSLKLDVSKKAMIKVSWISNSLNNVIGFGGVIGATIRYNYLEKFSDEKQKSNLKKSISFMLFSMLSGIAVLSFLVMIKVFDPSQLIDSYPLIQIGLVILSLALPIFLIYTWVYPPIKEDRFLVIKYTLVSVLDYLFVSLIMYLSLRFVGAEFDMWKMVSIFVVSSIAGIISMTPGGLGAFDVVFLLGATSQFNLSEEVVLLAIIFYRLSYNILPFFIGIIVSLSELQNVLSSKLSDQKIVLFTKEFGSIMISITQKRIQSLSRLLAMVLFTVITLLLIQDSSLALLYNLDNRYDLIIITASSIYLMITILLIPTISQIYKGSLETYHVLRVQLGIMLIAQVILFTQDGYYFDLILSSIMFLGLYIYRKTTVSKVNTESIKEYIVWLLTIVLLFIQAEIVWMFPEVLTNETAECLYWFVMIFSLVWTIGVVVYRTYLRRKYTFDTVFNGTWNNHKDDLQSILSEYEGTNLAHLAYLSKNNIAVHSEYEMGVIYQENRHFVFVLGDPFGNQENSFVFLQALDDTCRKIGKRIVFYQVAPKNIHIYNELNYLLFNLGEEGSINLETFKITGNSGKPYRQILNKQTSENISFGIETWTEDLGEELKHVSDEWLNGNKEMTFSVGSLDQTYIKAAEIATLRNDENKLLAFTTMMPTYQEGSLSVDLIRWLHEEHIPFMDILYLNVIQWAQEQGYQEFNIGMAPLSSSYEKTNSRLYSLTSSVYQHSVNFYSFKGIRNYKNKFKPHWEPRYLVYPKTVSLLRVLLESYRIIHPNDTKDS